MRNKPYTPGELFSKACSTIELPDILDYNSPARGDFEIRGVDWFVCNSLNYGGSEGIYLDLWLTRTNENEHIALGTFKTLETSPDAMRTMGKLLADFMVGLEKLINDEYDDFEWTGYKLTPLKEESSADAKESTGGYYTYTHGLLQKRLTLLLADYPRVLVRVNQTRKTIECTKENLDEVLKTIA